MNDGFHDGLAEHDEREHHDGAEHGHFGGMLRDDELIQQHADGNEEVQPSLSVLQKDGSSDLDRPRSPSLQASTWVIQSRPA